MKETLNRVDEILKWSGLSSMAFCKKIEFSYSAFRNYSKGRRPDNNLELYECILRTYVDISAEWLMRGEGPMLKSEMEIYKNTPTSELIGKIERLQDKIVELSRENGKLQGKLEAVTEQSVSGKNTFPSSSLSIAAEDSAEYKTGEKEGCSKM